MSDAVDLAIRNRVPVYSIGIGDTGEYGIDKDALRKLSERTGGRAFFPKKNADLSSILNEVGRELRNQYIVEYTSNRSSRSPKIQIETVNPALKGVRLSYERIAVPKKP